jgi:hypothetical protein
MSNYIRDVAIAAYALGIMFRSSCLYCQKIDIQYVENDISDMMEVKSNSEAAEILYKACRDSVDAESEDKQMGVEVRQYKVIDLNKDGRDELVLTLNYHSTGNTAPVRVIFAGEAISSCQYLRGYTPYGQLEDAIADLDHDGKMEIIMAEWMLPYRGTKPPVEWPVIYSLHGTTYIPEEKRFVEYYRKLAADLSQRIRRYELDHPFMDSDTGNRETLKWVLPMCKALRMTGDNKKAGMKEAITWSTSGDSEWREVAVALLADIGNEEALRVLAEMTHDREFLIRLMAVENLHKIGGISFLPVYEELLLDLYYEETTQSYPLRERARQYLKDFGVRVVGSNGHYKVEK